MVIQIIPAQAHHVDDIANIIKLAFEAEASPQIIAHIISDKSDKKHHTWIAQIDNIIVGFIDGFLTRDRLDIIRGELDLLAVRPDYQGKGIGKQLIEAFTQLPALQRSSYARALVRVDNVAMQHTIIKCGYASATIPYALYISSGNAMPTPMPTTTDMILVNTFTYSGIWLEGTISNAAIQHALNLREKRNLDIVGTVILKTDTIAIELLETHKFVAMGDYHWWIYKF